MRIKSNDSFALQVKRVAQEAFHKLEAELRLDFENKVKEIEMKFYNYQTELEEKMNTQVENLLLLKTPVIMQTVTDHAVASANATLSHQINIMFKDANFIDHVVNAILPKLNTSNPVRPANIQNAARGRK